MLDIRGPSHIFHQYIPNKQKYVGKNWLSRPCGDKQNLSFIGKKEKRRKCHINHESRLNILVKAAASHNLSQREK
jgi:hypothetical protein